MTLQVVLTAERPDLVPTVAGWLWAESWGRHGHSLEDTIGAVAKTVTATGMPHIYILLSEEQPVGTASLAASDLDARPELTPWLADVFVEPNSRGRGYAGRLTSAVESVCLERSVGTLWLYTRTAERIYARYGWRTVESFDQNGKCYADAAGPRLSAIGVVLAVVVRLACSGHGERADNSENSVTRNSCPHAVAAGERVPSTAWDRAAVQSGTA